MGKGGQSSSPEGPAPTTRDSAKLLDNIPTLVEIRRAIPPHCLQPTVLRSMSYVVLDVSAVIAVYWIWTRLEALWFSWFLLPVFWFVQGTLYTSIFVLGHDCGHGSFSRHPLLNDVMGTLLHTFILAPYFPWKLSHKRHHKNTGNIDRDEVFYPQKKGELAACGDQLKELKDTKMPLGFGLGFGWFVYLYQGYCPRHLNHFNVFDSLFTKHRVGVVSSVLLYASWLLCLVAYALKYSWWAMFSHHLVPVFVFACYMVIITFLHHNEVGVPWFADSEWDYVKGQLSTVDRDYGWPLHGILHHIGTHQIHHLFTQTPHYYLPEATRAFRKAFPHLVRHNPEPVRKAFMRMFNVFVEQRNIDDDTRVFAYQEGNGSKQQ